MNKVALYGNTYSDVVCYLKEYPEENKTNDMYFVENKPGGIHNVNRGISICVSNVEVTMNPMMLSEAVILFNEKDSTRTSMVKNISEGEMECNVDDADWHHISYIDNLTKITEQNILDMKKTGIVSVDFCIGLNEDILPILSNVNYIFGSKEDFTEKDIDLILNKAPDCTVVLHDKNGTDTYNSDGVSTIEYTDVIHGINPLGAGDYYVSCFIAQMLANESLHDTICASHRFATMMLKDEMLIFD